MLYNAESLESGKVTRILQSNFRNSLSVTDLANRILRIKQKRFGSIDRESNYLMRSVSDAPGEVVLVRDTDMAKRDLSRSTRRSAAYAVLVMRDEDKAAAKRHFDTPLLFSIHEAKGLEYENVILAGFISTERAVFSEIIEGIGEQDLAGDLEYRRARDRTDKSAEVYKFFINSLYVAVTRAVRKLYLIESDVNHPFIELLGLRDTREEAAVEEQVSSREEWQAEAHRLELQGRLEQAEEIRRGVLRTQPVPWEVCTPERVAELLNRARDRKEVSQKPRRTLYEYGIFYNEFPLMDTLNRTGFDKAKQLYITEYGHRLLNKPLYLQQHLKLASRHLQEYTGKYYKGVLQQCDTYGVDHRTVFNTTPLMMAVLAGNTALVRALLDAGADAELTDNYGRTAWLAGLERTVHDREYASRCFSPVHEILAPSSVSLKVDDRLAKLDSSQGEFLLVALFVAVLHGQFASMHAGSAALNAVQLAEWIASLPDGIVPAYRKKRTYISSLLSKNETGSTNLYGRKLFRRIR